jgi:hypothetical protein
MGLSAGRPNGHLDAAGVHVGTGALLMAKKHFKDRPQYLPQPFGLTQGGGARTGLTLDVRRGAAGEVIVNLQIAPNVLPEKTFFANYVHVTPDADGITVVFGKLETAALTEGKQLAALVELSCPFRPFYNQIYKSILTSADPGREAFHITVRNNAEKMGYGKFSPIAEKPAVTAQTKSAWFRFNAAMMALFEDDCAVDFYHLDAIAMRALLQGARPSGDLHGQVRVVMSPGLMHHFLSRVQDEAQTLKIERPDIDNEFAKPIG